MAPTSGRDRGGLIARRYTRLDWSTARTNLPARRLYRAIGSEAVPAVLFRLEGEALKRVSGA